MKAFTKFALATSIPMAITIAVCIAIPITTFTGCAGHSVNQTEYDAESFAADAAINATHTFNVYYDQTITGATPAQVASLNADRQQIYAVDTNLNLSLSLLDDLRTNYVASGGTNSAAITAALATVLSQSSTITNLVFNLTK